MLGLSLGIGLGLGIGLSVLMQVFTIAAIAMPPGFFRAAETIIPVRAPARNTPARPAPITMARGRAKPASSAVSSLRTSSRLRAFAGWMAASRMT